MTEQQQRWLIGPLQIIEHQQHRSLSGRRPEQGDDRLEQEEALGLGIVLRDRRKVGETLGEFGQEADRQRSVFGDLADQLVETAVLDEVADRFRHGLIGTQVLFEAAPEEHRCSFGVQMSRDLADET